MTPRNPKSCRVGLLSVNIGRVCVEPALALAPMAGATGHPLRILARERGCGLVFSEMIHARALLQGGSYSRLMTYYHEAERPVGLQIFGSDPALLARAAQKVEMLKADLVDLNLGCPAPRVVRNGEGGSLMRQPQLCSAIFEAVTRAVSIPVTVKMRKGWDERQVSVVEICLRAEEAGVRAVTIHGRTVVQGFSGKADWGIIREVKRAVGIPVFGNGDIRSAGDAAAAMDYSGCDGVMIGRAALGNPWIFEQVKARLEGDPAVEEPGLQDRLGTALRHLDLLGSFRGGAAALHELRRAAGWYLKGFPGAAQARRSLDGAATLDEMRGILLGLAVSGVN